MQTRRRELLSLVFIGLCSLAAIRAGAQEGADGDPDGPITQRHAESIERAQSSNSVAGRLITLTLHQATMKEALRAVASQADVRLMYNDSDLPADRLVTVTISDATVEQALALVLRGTKLRARPTEGGIAIEPRGHPVRSDRRMIEGLMSGRVTDATTGRPIAGVVVRLEEASLAASTGSEGTYRFPEVPAGAYTLTARRVGYERVVKSVIVADGDETRADLVMTPAPTILDQVVTTGTVIPTEVKALPTPVSVITADQIERRQPLTLAAVIRQAVPTSVAFDGPNVPANSSVSVRGASSLNGTGDMKIFIDGVEASTSGFTPVDVASIDRIEVVRGPQAATMYGADATSGVIQIFTKRGDTSLSRPQVDVRMALGASQTPYAGFEHVLRQQYSGSVHGSGRDVSYNLGGGYTRLGDYAPDNGTTRQSAPSVFAGMTFSKSAMSVDISARWYENNLPFAFNPLLRETGYASGSPPFYSLHKHRHETVGMRLTATPTDWWRNQITVGVDRFGLRNLQTQPRRTTESDTLLLFDDEQSRKLSLGYNATISGNAGPTLHGSLTLGVDHSVEDVSSLYTSQALNYEGTIRTSPPGAFSESLNTVKNTGYFVQLQTGVRDALFLTAGLRAEDNTTFGDEYGMAVLPRLGLSFVRPVGPVTLKLRASYGKALRAPSAGQASGAEAASSIQLENPTLRPERQEGWDGGVDLILGSRGSLGISVFDQTAKDLIAFLRLASVPKTTYQYQNIGRVSNRGIEIEATLRLAQWLQAQAQYGQVRSRIEAVGTAGGQVRVGDEPVSLPSHTAGLTVTATVPRGTAITAGVTYVGSWQQIDGLAYYRCLATFTEDACPASFLSDFSIRDFNVTYPGFAKVNATVTHRFTPQIEAFVSVDNLTNDESYEFSNASPVMGRSTLVGLHLTYR